MDLAPDRHRRAGERPGTAVEIADGLAREVGELVQTTSVTVRELLGECGPDDPMLDGLESIRATMHRLASLCRRLNAHAGRDLGAPAPIDLNALAGGMCALLQRLAGPFITLDLALEPRGAWVAANAAQIEQIILNLVMHARDALPLGGTIRVATQRRLLAGPRSYTHGVLPTGDWTLIEVRDSSAGMDEMTLSHLVEPALAAHDHSLGGGTDLATVQLTTQRIGGRIVVDSPADAGTAIAVCLPSVAAPRERRALRGAPQAILVVDGDEWVRTSTAHVLRRAGYGVLVADHAAGAIELLQDVAGRCIRLLLADGSLAGADGQRFVDTIRRDRPNLQVMVMANDLAMSSTNSTRSAWGPVLIKPFRAADLLQAIRQRFQKEV